MIDRPLPILKTSTEVAALRASCRLALAVLEEVRARLRPGVSTRELDLAAAARMRSGGAEPALDPRFPGSICLSVNEVAAHGGPSDYRLRAGDIITVDVALRLAGWCGDAAATFATGEPDPADAALIAAAREAARAGAAAARAGSHVGDIGAAVEMVAAGAGFAVLAEFVGHGIGRELHEEPEVRHAGRPGQGERLVPGMVLTIEPVLCRGSGRVQSSGDGWSFVTTDGTRAAQFEHTVAVFRDRTELLTDSGLY